MRLFYCGFNGYQQVPGEDIIIPKLTEINLTQFEDNINQIAMYFHWSYNIYLINGSVYKSGFSNDTENCTHTKLKLNQNSKIRDIFCKDDVLLFKCDQDIFTYKNNTIWLLEDISKALSDKYVTNNNPEVIQYLNLGKYCSEVVSLNRNLYLASSSIWQSEEQIIDISYGFEHTLLLTKQGKVYSWGTGSRGQLGHGELSDEKFPRLVEALDGVQICKISAGGWHSCAVGKLGELYTWGWNEKGQLGLPFTKESLTESQSHIANETELYNVMFIPKLITFVNDDFEVLQISSGDRHTVILGSDKKLYGAGWNKYKQLGINNNSDVITQFCEIPCANLMLAEDITLKCGPWSTTVVCT